MAAETSFPRDQIKILLLENVHASAHAVFENAGYRVTAVPKALTPAELNLAIADVHILGIRSKTQLTAEAMEHARRLLTVGCFCIGTNQVDLATANGRGVPVFNAPFSNTRSVAELVISEVIALARQLMDRSREVHTGTWKKSAVGAFEVRGKTLGIVGYGHIGSQVGVLAEALGMRVVFYDVSAKLPMGNNRVIDTLEELLAISDFVTLHVPETPQTKGMMGAAQIALMKEGAYLLNLSRGTVVDVKALAAALKTKRLAGAALDVYPEEPESNSEGFVTAVQGLPNVILTPHVAGSTAEAQAAIGVEVASALVKFTDTGSTVGTVNFPQIELAPDKSAHRILNVHKNVPGVLRDINRIVGELQANIKAQVLSTDPNIGYLMMDLERDVADEVRKAISALPTNIKTRILY